MKTSLLTTGPYMDMLFDAMFVPAKEQDGSFLWANPASTHPSFLKTIHVLILL
jgi:hypothetical protein